MISREKKKQKKTAWVATRNAFYGLLPATARCASDWWRTRCSFCLQILLSYRCGKQPKACNRNLTFWTNFCPFCLYCLGALDAWRSYQNLNCRHWTRALGLPVQPVLWFWNNRSDSAWLRLLCEHVVQCVGVKPTTRRRIQWEVTCVLVNQFRQMFRHMRSKFRSCRELVFMFVWVVRIPANDQSSESSRGEPFEFKKEENILTVYLRTISHWLCLMPSTLKSHPPAILLPDLLPNQRNRNQPKMIKLRLRAFRDSWVIQPRAAFAASEAAYLSHDARHCHMTS